MKKAFIIVGNANSGTRYITRLFIENGCFGQDAFTQKLDDGVFPKDNRDIVWKTHMPDELTKKETIEKSPGKKNRKFYAGTVIDELIIACEKRGYKRSTGDSRIYPAVGFHRYGQRGCCIKGRSQLARVRNNGTKTPDQSFR